MKKMNKQITYEFGLSKTAIFVTEVNIYETCKQGN